MRPPSFVNLQALEVMCRGAMVADVVAVIGTGSRRRFPGSCTSISGIVARSRDIALTSS